MFGAASCDWENLWPAPVAAVVIGLADLAYVLLARPISSSREFFVAVSLGLAGAALAVGFFVRDSYLRAFLIVCGAWIGCVWMLLGALSFGFLLAPAVLLALIAANRVTIGLRPSASWPIVIVAAAVTVGGAAAILALT